MADLDEELAARASEEEARKQEFEAQAQQQRLAQQQEEQEEFEAQERQSAAQNQAVNAAKQFAKNEVKKVAKKAIWEFIWGSAPIWGPIVAVIFGTLIIGIFILVTLISTCNQTSFGGFAIRVLDKANPFGGGLLSNSVDSVCNQLTVVTHPPSGGAGATGSFAGLDIVITSAYRAGAIVAGTTRPSAHGRGEAVDIALRNPTVPEHSSDPRIAQLVQIAKSAGFTPAAGDTLDEYTTPTEGASGGHIHVEFNTYVQNGQTYTYCDKTPVVTPPADLVALTGVSVDLSSTSDPRVRPCMLAAVQKIFNAAAAASTP